MADPRMSLINITGHSSSTLPKRGIFSSTLFQSSGVQFILPAHIWDRHKTHVVFVHIHHITIREYQRSKEGRGVSVKAEDDYDQEQSSFPRLETTLVKDDFDSVITGAKILKTDDFEPPTFTNSRPEEREIKFVNGDNVATDDDEPNHEYPPDVLVLTLRRDSLDSIVLLMSSNSNSPASLSLSVCQKKMPQEASGYIDDGIRESHRLGAHLAVEPHGRAIAVAAREKYFILYRLRLRQKWSNTRGASGVANEQLFDPFEEEIRQELNGTILKVDFLQPDTSDANTVILLLIISADGLQTQLQRWDWDTRKSLRQGLRQIWPAGLPVDPRFRQPHLLVPSPVDPGFWLFTDQYLAQYSDVMTGVPTVKYRPLKNVDNDAHTIAYGGVTKDSPRWTAFAQPARGNWGDRVKTTSHLLYLIAEDGRIQYLELGTGSEVDVRVDLSMDTHLIWTGTPNNAAFAIIPDSGQWDPWEAAVTAGGLFLIRPLDDFVLQQRFNYWGPLFAFSLADDTLKCISTGSSHLTSLHSALKVDVRWEVMWKSPELMDNVTAPASVVRAGRLNRLRIVTSSGKSSEVCPDQHSYPEDIGQDSGMAPETNLEEMLDWDSATVFAGSSSSGLLVQVTSSQIRVASGRNTLQTLGIRGHARMAVLDEVWGQLMLFAVDDKGLYIRYCYGMAGDTEAATGAALTDATDEFRPPIDIGEVACAATVAMSSGSMLCTISTWGRKIYLVHVTTSSEPSIIFTLSSNYGCESIVIQRGQGHFLVTLGLRDGAVRFIRFSMSGGACQQLDDVTLTIGRGPVQLVGVSRGVIALCDNKLVKLERGILDNVVFQRRVDISDAEFYREDFNAKLLRVAAVPRKYRREHDIDSDASYPAFFLFTSRKIVLVSAGECQPICTEIPVLQDVTDKNDQDLVTRQLIRVTPHSEQHIVAYRHIIKQYKRANGRSLTNGARHLRQSFARLGVCDFQFSHELNDDNTILVHKHSGTVVRDVFEWNANISGRAYKLVVVRVDVPPKKPEEGKPKGRLNFYALEVDEKGRHILTLRTKIKLGTSIDEAAVYNDNSIILSHGDVFEVMTLERKLDGEGKGFCWNFQSGLTKSGPPGRCTSIRTRISARGNETIYITTRNAIGVYEPQLKRLWESDTHSDMNQIHLQFHDDEDDVQPIILALSSEGISGYSCNNQHQLPNSRNLQRDDLAKIFQAKLHTSVVHALPYTDGWYIGSSSTGHFRQFKVIAETEWRLLRYLQSLAQQNKQICPLSYEDVLDHEGALKSPLDPLLLRPRDLTTAMHINGDILRRVTADNLENTLIPQARGRTTERSLSSAAQRLEYLEKLARDVSPDLVRDRPFQRIVEWTRRYWEPLM